MAKEAANADNQLWQDYFNSIKSVCPWSGPAYQKGLIDIVECMTFVYKPLDGMLARVYLLPYAPNKLKRLTQKMMYEYEEEEWLWGHPQYERYSPPRPCVIQQNHQYLEDIRKTLKTPV